MGIFKINQKYQKTLQNDLDKIAKGEHPESEAFNNILLLIKKNPGSISVLAHGSRILNPLVYFDTQILDHRESWGKEYPTYEVMLADRPLTVNDFSSATGGAEATFSTIQSFQKNVILYLNSQITDPNKKIDVESALRLDTLLEVINNMKITELKDFNYIDEMSVVRSQGEEEASASTTASITTSTFIKQNIIYDRQKPWKAVLINFLKIMGFVLLAFICFVFSPIILLGIPIAGLALQLIF